MGDILRGVDNEIPLLLILFYLRRQTARPIVVYFGINLDLRTDPASRGGGLIPLGAARLTYLGGEFGWGGTSSTRQRRCPKMSSVRTEISRSAKG